MRRNMAEAKKGSTTLLAVATEQGSVHILNTAKREGWDFGALCLTIMFALFKFGPNRTITNNPPPSLQRYFRHQVEPIRQPDRDGFWRPIRTHHLPHDF